MPSCAIIDYPANGAGNTMLSEYPDLLTVEHISEITELSPQTVRREINAGRLPGCHIGRRLFVPKCKFVEYAMGGCKHEA